MDNAKILFGLAICLLFVGTLFYNYNIYIAIVFMLVSIICSAKAYKLQQIK